MTRDEETRPQSCHYSEIICQTLGFGSPFVRYAVSLPISTLGKNMVAEAGFDVKRI